MEEPPPPPGVVLRHPEDFGTLRNQIYDSVKNSMSEVFPQSYGGLTMSLHELGYEGPDAVSMKEHKDAILKGGTLTRRLRGTIRLTDDATGKVIDERKQTLMRVPVMTDRGVFVHGGNNYSVAQQSRILPGVYTRRRLNGQIESQFNIRTGTGPQFKINFEPDTATYYLSKKGSRIRLHSVLQDLGVPDHILEKSWGSAILERNRAKYDSSALDKAAALFCRGLPAEATREDKVAAVKQALEGMQVHRESVKTTLPHMFDRHKAASIRSEEWEGDKLTESLKAAARKMLDKASGACVLFDLGKGWYLLERNTHGPDKGKLRPAGGGRERQDDTLRDTIVREIEEEFGLKESEVRPFLRLVGYQPEDSAHAHSPVFRMWAHGLRPGVYQASNDPAETVTLVRARLSDPRYIGPQLSDLYMPDDSEEE